VDLITRGDEGLSTAVRQDYSLVLTDLKMPGMSGMEFLTWAKQETNLPPIVILSYSASQESRDLTEKLGAKGYFVKSPDLKDTAAMIEALLALNQGWIASPNGDECRNPRL